MTQATQQFLQVPRSKASLSLMWFDKVGIDNAPLVEGKNASLGKMIRQLFERGIKVPAGFTTTDFAYYPGFLDLPIETDRKTWEKPETKGLELLQNHVKQAILDGVPAEYTQTSGSPGRVLCDLAHYWRADLILMGCRGHAGLSQLILGSSCIMHHTP